MANQINSKELNENNLVTIKSNFMELILKAPIKKQITSFYSLKKVYD